MMDNPIRLRFELDDLEGLDHYAEAVPLQEAERDFEGPVLKYNRQLYAVLLWVVRQEGNPVSLAMYHTPEGELKVDMHGLLGASRSRHIEPMLKVVSVMNKARSPGGRQLTIRKVKALRKRRRAKKG
ncbi:MAG: hypothetical protein ACE5NP_01715 [Anaerolineae bacterium]